MAAVLAKTVVGAGHVCSFLKLELLSCASTTGGDFMTTEYSRTFRVRWSETDAGGHVGLAPYLNYLIETAWDWGTSGGLSKAESERLGIVWVVRETELRIERPIRYNDEFDFTIWLYRWRRVRGTRCFEMRLRGRRFPKGAGILAARPPVCL